MNRKGILLLLFDLPSVTKSDKHEYRLFIKGIEKLGYMMLQESVYIKLIRNIERIERDIMDVEALSSNRGNIILIPLRENIFNKIVNISGYLLDIKTLTSDIIYM